MRFYKIVENDIIVGIGTGNGHEEITQEEYAAIMQAVRDRPTPEAGFGYRLKTDMTWELVEIPEVVDETELTAEEIAAAIEEAMA